MNEGFDDLVSAVSELEDALGSAAGRPATLLRDLLAVDLSSQVLQAARGTITLLSSAMVDVAYLTARHAFEASCDLLFLLHASPDPNLAGARGYVASHRSTRETIGFLTASGNAIGEAVPGRRPPIRSQIEAEADELDARFGRIRTWVEAPPSS